MNFEALRAFRLTPGARIRHQNACPHALATLGHTDSLIELFFAKAQLSELVGFLEASDRESIRPLAVVSRSNVTTAAETQAKRIVVGRSS